MKEPTNPGRNRAEVNRFAFSGDALARLLKSNEGSVEGSWSAELSFGKRDGVGAAVTRDHAAARQRRLEWHDAAATERIHDGVAHRRVLSDEVRGHRCLHAADVRREL